MMNISARCLLMATQLMFVSEIFNYQLAKSEKREGTYTAEMGKGRSVHFAIVKNCGCIQSENKIP